MAKGHYLSHRGLRLLAAPLLMSALLASCNGDDLGDVPGGFAGQTGRISFGVEVSNADGSVTRGQPQGKPYRDLQSSVGVFGFVYKTAWSNAATPDFMFNEELLPSVTKVGAFTTSSSFVLPKADPDSLMRYYAYYPYTEHLDGTEKGIELKTDETSGGAPRFEFTVAEKVEDQIDLLVGESRFKTGESTYSIEKTTQYAKDTTQLVMRHMLTAVRFKRGAFPNGTLKTIKLKGIKYKAAFDYANPTQWGASYDTTREFCDTLNFVFDDNNYDILFTDSMGGSHYFLMLPQTLGSDAKIELTYNDGSNDFVVEHALSGTWNRAKIVTYALGLSAARRLRLESTQIIDWEKGHDDFDDQISDKSFIKLRTQIEDWNESGDTVRGDNYSKTYADYGFFKYAVKDTTVVYGAEFNGVELTNTRGYSTSYSSSDNSVATIDAMGVVSIQGVGTTIIRATHAAEEVGGVTLYPAEEAKYTLTVTAAP